MKKFFNSIKMDKTAQKDIRLGVLYMIGIMLGVYLLLQVSILIATSAIFNLVLAIALISLLIWITMGPTK